jgi:hypothetical protein
MAKQGGTSHFQVNRLETRSLSMTLGITIKSKITIKNLEEHHE